MQHPVLCCSGPAMPYGRQQCRTSCSVLRSIEDLLAASFITIMITASRIHRSALQTSFATGHWFFQSILDFCVPAQWVPS